MGGHGPGGRVARGCWTRLYARSFYFDDGRDHHLALVSAELFAIPAGLHAKVLEAVNRSGAGASACQPPIAGFFNGAEGDISPDWLTQDR